MTLPTPSSSGSGSNITILYTSSSTTNNNSSSQNNATQRQLGRSNPFEVPMWLIFCYSVILLFAIVGNLLVITILVQNRRMRTITNVFLLNLAISDILLGVLCMPVTLVGTLLRHFIFGEFFCKLIQFSQAASVAISSWTLVAISCERYYAICHPLRSRRWQTRSHAYKIIVCIWCGSMLCMLPIAMFSQLMPTSRQGLRKCRENWPSYALPYERSYNIFLDLLLLVLPLIILSVTYILITRTLYVGMRIEKAMIFGGKQEHVHLKTPRKFKSGSLIGKNEFSSTSSLSTNVLSSSGLKLNLSQRYQDSTNRTTSYNNSNDVATASDHPDNFENNKEHLVAFCRQHNFQNYRFREVGKQQQKQHHQHQHQRHHQTCHEEQQAQQQPCCEPFSRLCCKISANTNSGRPHLYCMRFATLKTTLPVKEGNATSEFCMRDCCSSGSRGATLKNLSSNQLNLTPATISLTSSSSALTSTLTATTCRQQMMQKHQHNSQPQHFHSSCNGVIEQKVSQFITKTDEKKHFSKRSLKVTESVLRRNNIAKNLESKKRVVKMLFVLVLEFFICWTPLYIVNTVAMYIGAAIYEYIDYTTISVLQLLAYSSSCCNPITYCFMNANFRRAFWDTFKGMRWCGKRFQRKHTLTQNGANLCLAGSIRVNSCTLQTMIDSPRL